MAFKVLVFDSGLGGLSIALPLMKDNKDLEVDYIADDAFLPYGTKEERAINERVLKIFQSYLQNNSLDQAIIGCNTASTACLDNLRKAFPIPFIGVVPAIKPACQKSTKPKVGLLATPATVNRQYTDTLIKSFSNSKEIIKVGSEKLVYEGEKKILNQTLDLEGISSELQAFRPYVLSSTLDTIVLGCTHFPLLKNEMVKVFEKPVKFVCSTEAILSRSLSLLNKSSEPENRNLSSATPVKGRFFYTKKESRYQNHPSILQYFSDTVFFKV